MWEHFNYLSRGKLARIQLEWNYWKIEISHQIHSLSISMTDMAINHKKKPSNQFRIVDEGKRQF